MLFHYTNLVVFPEMSTQPDALYSWYPRQNQLINYLVWKAQKAATTIRESVDEIGYIVANTTLNLCRANFKRLRLSIFK
ncbi:hypothetical protein POPTR_006G038250v4 [Populus trichocarpa]|uniref:Uncharacterized protein n=1 Tax=Populus trichocarpa TaxID=3694 RepID=A0ACC0SRZ8_POPTR|nr:hypothetical protein POPTR_006G038250v4 [Populus trichocarpa]